MTGPTMSQMLCLGVSLEGSLWLLCSTCHNEHDSGCIGIKVNKNSITKGMEVDIALSKKWSNLQVPTNKVVTRFC